MGRLKRDAFLHPVKSLRRFLQCCSVRTAFAVYAVGAVALSSFAAFCAWYVLALTADNVYYDSRTVQSGLYLYDAQRDILIPAESLGWHRGETAEENAAGSQSESYEIYVSGYSRDTRYERAIDLKSDPESLDLHIEDVDAYGIVRDESVPSDGPQLIDVEDLAAYDAAENTRRGDAERDEAVLASLDGQPGLTVSRVAYYVYAPPPALWRVLNVMALLVIPIAFVVCFALVARAFYRAKLERPISVMGDAARRIASGDLDFAMPETPEGTHDELDRLSAAFETMRAELERANRRSWHQAEARRRGNAAFAHDMRRRGNAAFAHDMRTPLTVLKGRAEMLAAAAASGSVDAEKIASTASIMSSQVERLESYVESMRQLAGAQDCPVVKRAVGMQAWFGAVAESAEEAARAIRAAERAGEALEVSVEAAQDCPVVKRAVGMQAWFGAVAESAEEAARAIRAAERAGEALEVSVEAQGLPTVASMDEEVVGRVIENMVGNAARFAASTVAVRISWCDRELAVCVQDDGPGFDEPALAHACEAYWRQGSEHDGSSHLGLGLSICSGLCLRHGGVFEMANAEDGGACVTARFDVPVSSDSDSASGVVLQ